MESTVIGEGFNQLDLPMACVMMYRLKQRRRWAKDLIVLLIAHGRVETLALGYSFEGRQKLLLHVPVNILKWLKLQLKSKLLCSCVFTVDL